MILSPRGTSGSGKTTLARLVLCGAGVYHGKQAVFRGSRRNPLFYTRLPINPDAKRPIAILGSYENTTGGVDTISGNQIPFDLMRELEAEGFDVFCEGLLHSAEQHRTAHLHRDGFDVRLFYFTIPLADCLAGVQARRDARGNTTPLNPHTTRSRWSAIRHHPPRFRAMGVHVTEGDRLAGVQWLLDCGVISSELSQHYHCAQPSHEGELV